MTTLDLHLHNKCRDALRGGHDAWSVQSTGEKLAVALVLNKPEWIAEMNYTLAEAIERVGPSWIQQLVFVERALKAEAEELGDEASNR